MDDNRGERSKPEAETRELKALTQRIGTDLRALLEQVAERTDQPLNQFIADAAREITARAIGSAPTTRVALLIDLDAFSNRDPISMNAVERAASTHGRVVIKNSFATAPSSHLDVSKHALLALHCRHEDLQTREAVRLRIAEVALEIVREEAARDFVIVSGDEEVRHIATMLARRGRIVIGISVRDAGDTSPSFIRAFEEFHYYDQIVRPPESEALLKIRSRYAAALVMIAEQLEGRNSIPVGSALIPLLRDREPEVSPSLLEMRNWRELAEFARDADMATIEMRGGDFLLRPTKKGTEIAKALRKQSEIATVQRDEVVAVRAVIAGILGAELPEDRVRLMIFNTLEWVLNDGIEKGGIPLVDLSYRVARHIDSAAVQQNTIYRVLNGLYRAGAFDFEANPESEYNPIIHGLRISAVRCDDAFVLNLMRIKNKFPVHALPDAIATALYGGTTRSKRVESMLKLAAKPAPDRQKLAALLESITS